MEGKVRTKKDVNIQHSTLNIAVGFNSQLTNSQSQALAENNSTFNTQNSTFKLVINVPKNNS